MKKAKSGIDNGLWDEMDGGQCDDIKDSSLIEPDIECPYITSAVGASYRLG